MNSLKNHVDSIFSKYKSSEQINELKYEVGEDNENEE